MGLEPTTTRLRALYRIELGANIYGAELGATRRRHDVRLCQRSTYLGAIAYVPSCVTSAP
jgi:hypothetical protein